MRRARAFDATAAVTFPRLAPLCLLACVLGAAGCVYRIDIQQGNYLEEDVIEQVEPGMTRSQVRFLLGTPMVADPFHAERWDYVYYFKRGRGRSPEMRHLTVYFEDDAVTRMEHGTES